MLGVPTTFAAGDSLRASFTLAAHRPAAGWLVVYFFRSETHALDVAAIADGPDGWRLELTPAQTAAMPVGIYTVAGVANKAPSERVTFESGIVSVTVNLAAVAGHNGASHARRVLSKLEQIIEQRADKSIISHEVDGFSVEHLKPIELLEMRRAYRAEVMAEERALQSSAGLVLGRFSSW